MSGLKAHVFKQNGDLLGETQINCPASPPEPSTIKYIITGSGEPKTWRIEMTLTNTNNGHTDTQVFNGRYTPADANKSIGGQVTVDGVSLGGGTGYR